MLLKAVIARTNAQLASSPTPDAKGRTLPQGTIEWPALKRMLDRRDASYKALRRHKSAPLLEAVR